MEGKDVLEVNSWFLLDFFRQLLIGGEGILETSGLDCTQSVQFSLAVSNLFEV